MKNRILIVFVLCLFSLSARLNIVRAADTVPLSSGVAAEEKIEYTLPYPGILPDHPLYSIKRFRDYVLELVIADPVRKAEFYILQGDKRLQMGIMLHANKKDVLAETTISKGEKYLGKAIDMLVSYKKNSGTIPEYIVEKIQKSLQKHGEEITVLLQNVSEAQKRGLTESLQYIQSLQKEIEKLN